MLRFLSSLFGSNAVVPPAKRLGIDLVAIDHAVIEAQRFPRPQWAIIREWIKAMCPRGSSPSLAGSRNRLAYFSEAAFGFALCRLSIE
jgi:hypothetical protein